MLSWSIQFKPCFLFFGPQELETSTPTERSAAGDGGQVTIHGACGRHSGQCSLVASLLLVVSKAFTVNITPCNIIVQCDTVYVQELGLRTFDRKRQQASMLLFQTGRLPSGKEVTLAPGALPTGTSS